jgi:hypothetical protein
MGRIVVGFRGTEHEHVSQRGLESGSTRNVHDRYFEDYLPGIDVRYGAEEITEADALRGVIASGWHTAALMMRICATSFLNVVASLTSPGVDELRWVQPVRQETF